MIKTNKTNFYLLVCFIAFSSLNTNTLKGTGDKSFFNRIINLLKNYMSEENIEGDVNALLSNNNGNSGLWSAAAKSARAKGNKKDAQMLESLVSSQNQSQNELRDLDRSLEQNEYSLTGFGSNNYKRTFGYFTNINKRVGREELFPFLQYIEKSMSFAEYEQGEINKDIARILGMSEETYNNDTYITADERFLYSWAYRLGGNEGLELTVKLQRKGKLGPWDILSTIWTLYSSHYKYISLWWKVYQADPIVKFEKNLMKLKGK